MNRELPMIRCLLLALLTAPLAQAASTGAGIDAFREGFRSVTPRTFDSGGEVARRFHLDAPAYLEMATIARTVPERPLPLDLQPALAALEIRHPAGRARFGDYVTTHPLVDGVILLHGGRVVFEAYPRMAPWQRHFAWSVSKVVVSTALAALVAEERVDMSANVAAYVPLLAGTAWDGTSVRDVANMASGIDCRDADGYQTSSTCIYRLEEALGITAPTGYEDGLEAHLRAMSRRGPAGRRNEYASANTIVLSLVIEAVTGSPFSRVVQDRLWAPMGAEADGLMAISPEGFSYASAGLSLRLRDLARFGELVTRPAEFGVLGPELLADMQGVQGIALDAERLARMGDDFPDDLPVRAAWQWDLVWPDGALYKGGYSGQGLYVDPARQLVMAWFGTGEHYGATNHALTSIARQLARSGLFEAQPPTR
ncbi:MAG: serine hydrolase domain-containing protein [Pseudomonadales bacterium]|jgi:CubicO group peptidase (beta-lactamase class C family)|nr:serine hydrolase domain-containing protein [Pseudomonadales bacterium]